MAKRGFDKNDFARNHPGGELGKQLALKVETIMHPINQVAQITPEDSISDCAILMPKNPLGAALFIDNGNLKGIVTEGDLRKSITQKENLSDPIGEFVNEKPICIPSTTSIFDAMKVMEDRESQISVLPVVDSNNECIGLLTIHDLYQTKLV